MKENGLSDMENLQEKISNIIYDGKLQQYSYTIIYI